MYLATFLIIGALVGAVLDYYFDIFKDNDHVDRS